MHPNKRQLVRSLSLMLKRVRHDGDEWKPVCTLPQIFYIGGIPAAA
jgi:hypothetical protein